MILLKHVCAGYNGKPVLDDFSLTLPEHGITVLYVPYENADSVAELIVALSLTLLRKLHLADRLVQSGAPIANAPPQLFGR